MSVPRADVEAMFGPGSDPASVGVAMTPDEELLILIAATESERVKRKELVLKAILWELDRINEDTWSAWPLCDRLNRVAALAREGLKD